MVSSKSLKKSPFISVIMPAYNAEKYISSAIESILQQTFTNFELIIIDDKSQDNTWEVIEEFSKKDTRIKALRNNKNLKLSKTLNKGIKISIGKYIARMDADDWSYPNRLEKQVMFLENNPDFGIVGGSMNITNEEGKIIGKRGYPLTDAEIRKKIFWYSPYSHPLIMIRKTILDIAGLYDDYYNPAEDYDLYFRIGRIAKFANLPVTLLKYRVIPKSMTTGSTNKMETKTIEIREKYSHDPFYSMSSLQKIYNLSHKLSMYIFPSQLKMKAFQFIRNYSK